MTDVMEVTVGHTGRDTGPRDGNQTSKLKMKILASGYPAYVIAAQVGISGTMLSYAMNNKRRLASKHMLKIADLLGCHPGELIGNVEEQDNYGIEPLRYEVRIRRET